MSSLVRSILSLIGAGHGFDEWTVWLLASGWGSTPQEAEGS